MHYFAWVNSLFCHVSSFVLMIVSISVGKLNQLNLKPVEVLPQGTAAKQYKSGVFLSSSRAGLNLQLFCVQKDRRQKVSECLRNRRASANEFPETQTFCALLISSCIG